MTGIQFSRQITVGNVLSILTILGSLGAGVAGISGSVTRYAEQLKELQRQVAELRVSGQNRETELLGSVSNEARLREQLDRDLRNGIERLGERLDDLARQRRGDAAAPPQPEHAVE